MTRIVCGVDGSSCGRRALEVAAALRGRLGGDLVAVHVVAEPPDGGRPYETALRLSMRHAVEHGERQLESAIASVPAADGARGRLETGPAADRLAGVAQDEDAALLVVGSRGLGHLKTALLGSVSRTLAGRSPCPLVVVPDGVELPFPELDPGRDEQPDGAIAVGIDESAQSRDAARFAGQLAERLERRLVLVHADRSRPPAPSSAGVPYATGGPPNRSAGSDALARATDLVPSALSVEIVLERGRVEQALVRAAVRRAADFIVVGSRGLAPLRAMLWGSVSTRLAASSPRPVMIVPRGWDAASLLPDVEDAAA